MTSPSSASIPVGSGPVAGSRPVAEASARTFGEHGFFGHPRALAYLAGTEFWDVVSFRGMQALLVLYMVDELLRPAHVVNVIGFAGFRAAIEAVTGPLTTTALAAQIFGLYTGLIYFTPVIGGYLGDRFLGRRAAVIAGAALMTLGHACMAFDRTFLVALLLLVSGAGLLRGNLAPQLGALYAPDDPRRPMGFQIYFLMVNTGLTLAPLVTGGLAQWQSYHFGLGAAGVGMACGIFVYVAGLRHLPPAPRAHERVRGEPLTPGDRRKVATLVFTLPLLMLFWLAQAQIWNVYNLWARDYVNLRLGGFDIPVPWLQGLDAGCVVLMTAPVLWRFRQQARAGREADEIGKLATGSIIFGLSVVELAAAHWLWSGRAMIPLWWVLGFHLLSNIGYLYFAPTALSLFSRVAPPRLAGMMIGIYFLSIFLGVTLSGRMGGLYETLSPATFWLAHAVLAMLGGGALLLTRPLLNRRFGITGAEAGAGTPPHG